MHLEKPKLFPEKKGFFVVMGILLFILCIRLYMEYQNYQKFITKPFYYTYANVLHTYEKTKGNKRYQILKLRSDEGLVFYTTSFGNDTLNHKRLRLQLFPNADITFQEYLGTFYVKSRIKDILVLPVTLKDELLEKVASQHTNISMQSFYNAIFFATPVEKDLRKKISLLGVSHLVALSGFHLGILWGLVYGLLYLFYKPFQQKYFPYRHALFDVGLVAMLSLGIYLWFVDFPPSLVRSYAMVLVGWIVLLLGMELLSFVFLTIILLTLVALFPSLLVSLSFWLSVSGVFYIFLLLEYTKEYNKWLITFIFIPIGIFIFMLPVVHYIFGVTTVYQLLSPMLSILFVPFYPLAMILHLLGYGDVFDGILLWLFALPEQSEDNLLPLWMMVVYVTLSLGAIWNRWMFYLTFSLATLYMLYLFMPIEQITKF